MPMLTDVYIHLVMATGRRAVGKASTRKLDESCSPAGALFAGLLVDDDAVFIASYGRFD